MDRSSFAAVTTYSAPLDTLRLDRAMLRYANGDGSAFPELFQLLAPRLRKQLRALCRSEELAHELLQETFLRIHRGRASFRRERAVVPWAHAIARNCYRSHVRAWGTRLLRASSNADDCALPAEIGDDTEARAIARETARALEEALAPLGEVQRKLVYLRAQGHSVGSVAGQLGLSEGAVKLRSFRTCRVLRHALQQTPRSARRRAR